MSRRIHESFAVKLRNSCASGRLEERREELLQDVDALVENPMLISELVGAIDVVQDHLVNRAPCELLHRAAVHLLRTKDNRAEKIVSHKFKYLWVCNPKVASRSIIDSLKKIDPSCELISGVSLAELLEVNPHFQDYYKFGFVRDPYSRAYSAYTNKILTWDNPDVKTLFYDRLYGTWPGMSFPDFVYFLVGPFGVTEVGDRHFIPQVQQFLDRNGKVALDFIGHMDTLPDDMHEVCRTVGLPTFDLPFHNSGNVGKVNKEQFEKTRKLFEDHYTDELVLAINARYEDDFKAFGFSVN